VAERPDVTTSTDRLAALNEALQQEIDERKRIEARLESLARIPEESPDPVLRLSVDGLVLYANKPAETVLTAWGIKGPVEATVPEPWLSLVRELYQSGARTETELTAGERDFSLIFQPLADEGYVNIYGVDVTERKRAEEEVRAMSNRDDLTRLPNRILFTDRLKQIIYQAKRNKTLVAVHLIDLDNFTAVNENFGYDAGDALLKKVAESILVAVRETDTVARLSADEFAVIQNAPDDAEGIAILAQKLLRTVGADFIVEDATIPCRGSIGISVYPNDTENADEMLRNAELALRHGRAGGVGGYHFFVEEMNEEIQRRRVIEESLRQAIEREEFFLVYQPKLNLAGGTIAGMESLIRWMHPEHGFMSPVDFIPAAERTGLIVPIGEWCLREACRQTKVWMDSGLPKLKVAVNLSAVQFHHSDLPATVGRILDETGLPPECLELEITETVAMTDAGDTTEIFQRISDLGVSLSIDDFGTGYSSLSYLKNFPVQRVKIDKAFVDDIIEDDAGDPDRVGAIARAVTTMGHSFGMEITAEGVETEDQLRFLQRLDCDEIQGYYFARPLPAAEFEPFVRDHDPESMAEFRLERRGDTSDRRNG